MGRIVSCQMVIMPGRWLLPPPRSPLFVPRSNIGYPTGGRPTILIWSQDNLPPTMSSKNPDYRSPPRRKVLRVVGVRPSKRDWAAPADPTVPIKRQKPQLLCARCGHTWEPRQYILRSGRLPKRCPRCASPRWNQPYVRIVSRTPNKAADAH